MRLLTAATPNGWKVSIMVEELREQGHALDDLEVETIDLMKGEQFEPDFMAICPNQKIPALVDGDCNLMESCAILEYLAERFPTSLLPSALTARFKVLQWVYWQAANVGPVFGNKLSYTRYMDDVDPQAKAHPMERFANEAQRLMGVLSRQLEGKDWVCGDTFTIADIALYPWVQGLEVEQDSHCGYSRPGGLGGSGSCPAGCGPWLGVRRTLRRDRPVE